MKKFNPQTPAPTYDPRWFIWTIVFLLATGVSLVCYIMISSESADTDATITTHQTVVK